MIVGIQVVGLGLCGRAYGYFQLGERDPGSRMAGRIRLEHGLLLGAALILVGFAAGAVIVATWIARGFGTLPRNSSRSSPPPRSSPASRSSSRRSCSA